MSNINTNKIITESVIDMAQIKMRSVNRTLENVFNELKSAFDNNDITKVTIKIIDNPVSIIVYKEYLFSNFTVVNLGESFNTTGANIAIINSNYSIYTLIDYRKVSSIELSRHSNYGSIRGQDEIIVFIRGNRNNVNPNTANNIGESD
ncbi:MAG: hypothetical protein QW046_04280 [Candidatus Micrarchaeaceae archaeon]